MRLLLIRHSRVLLAVSFLGILSLAGFTSTPVAIASTASHAGPPVSQGYGPPEAVAIVPCPYYFMVCPPQGFLPPAGNVRFAFDESSM